MIQIRVAKGLGKKTQMCWRTWCKDLFCKNGISVESARNYTARPAIQTSKAHTVKCWHWRCWDEMMVYAVRRKHSQSPSAYACNTHPESEVSISCLPDGPLKWLHVSQSIFCFINACSTRPWQDGWCC